jgi:hypothetical protein
MTALLGSVKKNELLPFIPLLIGQGKLATHLSFYLSQKNIAHEHWKKSRDLSKPELLPLLKRVNAVWILVSDQAINEVSLRLRDLAPGIPILHSSAATEIPGLLTLHPMQTFGPELYPLTAYEKVPFVFIREEWELQLDLKNAILSALSNPTLSIPNSKRILYHAHCVMMANFPQLLWSKVCEESSPFLRDARMAFAPLLEQTVQNFIVHGKKAVTGPLIRGDKTTLEKHIRALQGSPLLPLYENFCEVFNAPQTTKAVNL